MGESFSFFFFFKHKTAYVLRISDWSSDVCSSDLISTSLDANGLSCGGIMIARLCVVDDQAVDFVRDILEGVGDAFEMAEKLARDQEARRVRLAMFAEQALEADGVDIVRMTFHPHQPFGQFVEARAVGADVAEQRQRLGGQARGIDDDARDVAHLGLEFRSEEHTSELQSLMRTSYTV